jgi:isocitrate dehydrogenase
MAPERGATIRHEQVIELLQRVNEAGFDFIKIENLYNFDGKASYSAVQGE